MSASLQRVLDVLRQRCDVDFRCYDPARLQRRIQRRIEQVADSDAAYAELLYTDPSEADSLYHDLLVGVTEFFCDREAYAQLGRAVRKRLKQSADEVRVWVAGCATGEELYSVAMLLVEARAHLQWAGTLRVFATDVHQDVLKQAADGIFSKQAVRHVSAPRRRRYFVEEGDHFRVVDALREMAVFVNHNLVTDAPFMQLDILCCRNVLSYFEPETRRLVLEQFRFGLRSGGLLFLGPGETPSPLEKDFEALHPASSLYVKLRGRRLTRRAGAAGRYGAARRAASLGSRGEREEPRLEVYEALLERYMPAAFVLDDGLRLVSCFGGAERLLACHDGDPSSTLPTLLEGRLKSVVTDLLERYARQGGTHTAEVRAAVDRTPPQEYRITVSPLGLEDSSARPILVELRSRGG